MSDVSIVTWFQRGGAPMFLILFLALIGLGGTIAGLGVGVISKRRGPALAFGAGLLGIALLCGAGGVGGYLWSHARIEAAVVGADPQLVATLRAVGEAESGIPLRFGLGAAALPALSGVVLLALGLARPAAGRRGRD
jgi:hypothetical protein